MRVTDCGVAYGVEVLFRVDTTPEQDAAATAACAPPEVTRAVDVLRALQQRGVGCEDLYVLITRDIE
jgi:hypothetical protein